MGLTITWVTFGNNWSSYFTSFSGGIRLISFFLEATHPTLTLAYKTNRNSQVKSYSKRCYIYAHFITLVVWIMRDSPLNQGKLCLPMMGWRIKSSESLWVLVLLYYPGSGTGWWWDQIPHCRWGRCTGSCRQSSHTGLPRTAPSSSHTHSRLRKTGEKSAWSVKDQTRTNRYVHQGWGKVMQRQRHKITYSLSVLEVINTQLKAKENISLLSNI